LKINFNEKANLDDNNIKSPKTNERFSFGDDTFLEDAVAVIPIPIIIIVDGLEKVISR
jgi:hypothetical protein